MFSISTFPLGLMRKNPNKTLENFMRKLFYLLVLFFLATTCVFADANRAWLLGKWKSNRALTVASIKLKSEPSKEAKAKLEALFGRMELTFTDTKLEQYMPATFGEKDWRYSSTYTLVAVRGMKVVVSSENGMTHKPESTAMTFENRNRFSVPLDKIEGREYFDRVAD